MKNQLNIPSKIRVGFNHRSDTYTNKLAYVIYYDAKGVLRKKTSWDSWRENVGQEKRVRTNDTYPATWETITLGDDFEPVDYDNVPTEGFVLNKKAGGTSWGWSSNVRQTKCRVFDPRGFEFEISIENLLFILQETNSIKGKGLEGEFVYSWEGKDIVLLPVNCIEYKESAEFTSLKTMKVTKADMEEGCSYLTKDQKEVIYLGRYPWYELVSKPRNYSEKILDGHKQHVFVYVDKLEDSGDSKGKYYLPKGFTGLAKKTSDTPISNFAEVFDKFAKSRFSTKPIGLELKPKSIEFPELDLNRHHGGQPSGKFYLRVGDNKIQRFHISVARESTNRQTRREGEPHYKLLGYQLLRDAIITFDDDKLLVTSDNERGYSSYSYSWNREKNNTKFFTQQELLDKGLQELFVDLESGNKVELNKY